MNSYDYARASGFCNHAGFEISIQGPYLRKDAFGVADEAVVILVKDLVRGLRQPGHAWHDKSNAEVRQLLGVEHYRD